MTARYRPANPGIIEQTAILRDVSLPEVHAAEGEQATASLTPFPWLVVLTQDCDLELDRLARAGQPAAEGKPPVSKDKVLRSILLCPAFLQDHVTAGTYVAGAKEWRGTELNMLVNNRHERFHVLPADSSLVAGSLAVDFKLILAVHPAYLERWVISHPYSAVCVLVSPYKERLMQRFVNYFGRIAEPDGE